MDPTPVDPGLLRRLEANAVEAAARGRITLELGPFRAFLTPDDDLIYLNYAVPVAPCDDWSGPLEALCAAFVAHQRRPRLEYMEALWPSLAPALEATGFELEMAAPVMILERERLVEPPVSGATVRLLRADDPPPCFADAARVAALGFGQEPPQLGEAPGQEALEKLAAGQVLQAVAYLEAVPAACGVLSRTGEVAEMAGVATVPALRRRGIAAHLCAALLKAGFDAGIELVWLSAGSVEAVRLYEMLGFQHAGHQRHCSRPG